MHRVAMPFKKIYYLQLNTNKKFKLIILALCISATSFAQVGIGTNTPTAGSILELKAADKALLLTRVANTAAVTTPVNGMMIYDISSNCIKGYQNGAWTDCLSACANTSSNVSTGGDFGLDFTFTMKQMSSSYDASSGNAAACVTTDGKVFYWGANNNPSVGGSVVAPVTPTATVMSTPVYLPLPNGELADKVSLGGYGMMALTTTGNVYIRGIETSTSFTMFGGFAIAKVWTKVVIAGESTFVDAVAMPSGNGSYLRGSSGKIYRCGRGITAAAPEKVAVYTPMLFPVGVTSYTDMWADLASGGGGGVAELFLKGNDGNIYAVGSNTVGQLGIGNITNVNTNSTPVKVLFPAGVNIVKISCNDFGLSLALSSTGTAYAWGKWRISSFYYFAATPAPADISGDYILKPSLISLPTGYNDTQFTDIWAGVEYTAVRTDKMVYFKGINYSGILENPVISNNPQYSNSSQLIDMNSGATYSQAAPTWNKFKTIITGGNASSYRSVYAISQSDRGYVWGAFNSGSSGIGAGSNSGLVIYKPTLIATGIGDPMNPNPLY